MEYIAPAPAASPVVEYISPGHAVYAAPASVVENIAPAPAARPVVEYISPDPAVYVAKAPVVELIAPAPVARYATPVPTAFAAPAPGVELICPDPMVYVAPALVAEYISPDGPGSRRAVLKRRRTAPAGEWGSSGSWPCSSSRSPTPRPLPSSVYVELSGAKTRQGSGRSTVAHAVKQHAVVALSDAGQHSSRAAR